MFLYTHSHKHTYSWRQTAMDDHHDKSCVVLPIRTIPHRDGRSLARFFTSGMRPDTIRVKGEAPATPRKRELFASWRGGRMTATVSCDS